MEVVQIREELKNISGEGIVLIETSSDDYFEVNMELLKHLVNERDLPGVYVTLNKPYNQIKEEISKRGIDGEGIFYVDVISEHNDHDYEEQDDAIFMDSPEDLTGLSIVISEAVESMGDGPKFVFMDSLTTLKIYNDMNTVSKFAHYLTGQMRSWDGVVGIILSIKEEMDDELGSRLSQFCDDVIKLD